MAKKYGGRNWREVYQSAWLRLREQELKGKTINDPESYFFFIVRNICNKTNKHKTVSIETILNTEDKIISTKFEGYTEALNKYINKKPKTEDEKYYQQFCELLILTGGKCKEFRELTDIPQNTFYRHLRQLQKNLNNELKSI